MDLFPDSAIVRETQKDLDKIIQNGVFEITKLLKNSEAEETSATSFPSSSPRHVNASTFST